MTAKGFTRNNLIEAIRAGHLDGIIQALDDGGDIELPDMHGCAGLPLRTACFEGKPAIVHILLEHGANPNAVANDGPGAPLRLARRKGHQDIAELLLQYGALPAERVTPTPETSAAPSPSLPPESTLDNSIEYSRSSLPLPISEANTSSLSEYQSGNLIEFSSPDNNLQTNDAEAASHFGIETSVLSMNLLFLDENEATDASLQASDKHG